MEKFEQKNVNDFFTDVDLWNTLKVINNIENSDWDDQSKKERKEKQEIKKQYPYRTDEDVDARYEIEHMQYRSADIMESLHSGKMPSEVLKNYKADLKKRINKTITYHENPHIGDGYTCTKKYDEYGRIVSSITKFDTVENGENTSTYTYNPDGSYTVVNIENNGKYKYEDHYDIHGKRISQIFNDGSPEDYSKQQFAGDINRDNINEK